MGFRVQSRKITICTDMICQITLQTGKASHVILMNQILHFTLFHYYSSSFAILKDWIKISQCFYRPLSRECAGLTCGIKDTRGGGPAWCLDTFAFLLLENLSILQC